MSPEDEGPSSFTSSQRRGLETRRSDQERTLAAIHQLETSLESPAPRRQERWRHDVTTALVTLDEATAEEAENASRPDSLFSDIARSQPRLRNRVRGLRTQYRQLRDRIQALRREVESEDSFSDFGDARNRLAEISTGLRRLRARESDLIYEAYYDAFGADLREERGTNE
jgi:cell fate (sporulation/competence/biofilm development) regulator YlbF (YheA/YmcA/DUF963 family)